MKIKKIDIEQSLTHKIIPISIFLMQMVGLEPTRGRPYKILSLVRLPFRHIRMSFTRRFYSIILPPALQVKYDSLTNYFQAAE